MHTKHGKGDSHVQGFSTALPPQQWYLAGDFSVHVPRYRLDSQGTLSFFVRDDVGSFWRHFRVVDEPFDVGQGVTLDFAFEFGLHFFFDLHVLEIWGELGGLVRGLLRLLHIQSGFALRDSAAILELQKVIVKPVVKLQRNWIHIFARRWLCRPANANCIISCCSLWKREETWRNMTSTRKTQHQIYTNILKKDKWETKYGRQLSFGKKKPNIEWTKMETKIFDKMTHDDTTFGLEVAKNDKENEMFMENQNSVLLQNRC